MRRFSLLTRPWLRRSLYGLAAFLLLFALFGYFALPGIIKSQAEKLAGEALHRQLSIERVEFRPFSLVLDIHGARLMEPDGKTVFVAFEDLHVDVSARSLLHLAPVVKGARLHRPYVHLARIGANRYNVDDIVQMLGGKPPAEKPARFAAFNLEIDQGRIEFDDQPVAAKHVVSNVSLGVPFVSSLASDIDILIEPLLSAKINGAPFLLKGKARPFAEPRDATLAINLDDVDLTRYFEYLPFKPRFKLPTAKLDLHLTTVFRQAKNQAPALLLKGTTAIRSLKLTEPDGKPMLELPLLAVTIDEINVLSPRLAITRVLLDHPKLDVIKNADGNLNLSRLTPPEQTPRDQDIQAGRNFVLSLGELAIQGARINYRDDQARQPLDAGIDNLDLRVGKTEVNLGKKTVSVAAVTSTGAAVSLVHGKPLASDSVSPAKSPRIAAVKATASRASAQGPPAYVFTIAAVEIDNWSMRVEDRSLPSAAATTVSALKLDAKDISNASGAMGHAAFAANVNKMGRIAVNGAVGLIPLHADLALNLKSVDLLPVQPYVTDRVNLLITRAALSAQAALKVDEAADGKLKGRFKGDLALVDVATIDRLNSNDFLHWKSLSFGGVEAQLAPLALNVDRIALDDFFARIIIDKSGRINLQDIVRGGADEENPTSAVAAVPPIRINQVKLQNGQVRFTDKFIRPNYSAELKDIKGTVSGLSSDAASDADVRVQGTVNNAPLNVTGRINPLKDDFSLDLKANVRGMELAPLSPYSGKYVGYGIEKGKLSFEVAYHQENRKLQAESRLTLDQLTLGKKVESPSATTLPVRLALSLLSDRNGIIDVNLPVSGSLDDPKFSIGGVIGKAILNLIAKAVTAPFKLLGSLFGGGEELSWLEFDAGRYVVPRAGEAKLDSLAKALNDRPALRLEITGRFDPALDREGLRSATVEHKVRALKLKQLVAKGESADLDTVAVTPAEYPVLLARVYKNEDFPKPRNMIGLQKDLPVPEMEKLMMASAKVSDDDLVALGNRRAQAVKDWMVNKGAIPAERVFIVATKGKDDGDKLASSRVDFSLR